MPRKITKASIDRCKEACAKAQKRVEIAQEKLAEAEKELEQMQLIYDAQCWREHQAMLAAAAEDSPSASLESDAEGDAGFADLEN